MGMIVLGFCFLYIVYRYISERRIWNKGICKETGTQWVHIATDGASELHRTLCGKKQYWFHFHFRK